MKYTSLTDLLDLNLDQISELNANSIIRLQKQLKAKAMLEDNNNLGEITKIIDDLKSDSLRACYIFVEKHAWLKHLISGNFEDIKLKDIEVDESSIQDLETLKYFLNDYLKENLIVFISNALSKGKYEHIQKVLQHNYLFTEAINQLVINFFKARLNYAIAYLQEGKLSEKQFPVAFISNKIFIKSLNAYPDAFNEEIQDLNSEVIDIYNRLRRNTSRDNFRFCAKVMVAFADLDTSKAFLKETLESNAEIAKEYAYSSNREKEKSGSGPNSWSVIFVVFIVIRLIFWIGKSVSNDSRPDYNPINFDSYDFNSSGIKDHRLKSIDSIIKEMQKGNAGEDDLKDVLSGNSISSTKDTSDDEIEETVIESTEDIEETVIESAELIDEEPLSKADKRKLVSHIRFLYSLKYKYYKKPKDNAIFSSLYPNTNPYPKTFNLMPGKSRVSSIDNITLISNKSNEDLVVFRLKSGVDQSVYIPRDTDKYVYLRERDCLAFYTGTDFIKSKFSHFKNDGRLSELYKIKKLERGNSTIIVYPPKKGNTDTSKKRVQHNAYDTDNLSFYDLSMKPLYIDELYKQYYNNYYNKN
ncbi:hypothetical protein [Winogradskyella algicola]|uniref:hypothetical protein n=1 Tax=Winogradskyella algicola TaxID=2575815 RepID=UPI001109918E|nr:hypothetical protein [Winogradskyella algicola]